MTDGGGAGAFVPGHVTGLFTVHREADPLRTGSRGAGVTLSDGVTVRVERASEPSIVVDGSGTQVASVENVLSELGVTAAVEVETDLPLGAGFGLSGGMALGTALAANEAFGLARSENDLLRTAHRGEVVAGTGLGDVVAQARGGMPIRLEPGAPPHGELDGIPARGRVEYLTFGELSTPEILAERPEAITEAGTAALEYLRERPTTERFMEAAGQFTESVGLLTPDLEAVIETVSAAGGQATMAMLGKTVFALGTDLSDAGFDPTVTSVHQAGARLRGGADGPP